MKMDSLQSDYRDMLINVGELVDENKNYLEAMKFRCKSIIKGKENEGINSALDLWTALEKRELIGPNKTAFLKELLNTCMKRIMPPMRIVENYEAQAGVQGQQRQHQHYVGFPYPQQQYGPVPPQVVYHVQTSQHAANGLQPPDLKKEIGFMSKNLGRDWKSLMRQLGVSEATMETIMSEHRSVREQIYQCFLAWQDQEQENASKERLMAALRVDSVFQPAGPPVGPPAEQIIMPPARPPVEPEGPPNTSLVEAQPVNREPMGQTGDMLQQLRTTIDPTIAGLLPALGNFITQLQQLSMNPAPPVHPGSDNAGNQIPPTNQHPMYNPVIGESDLVGQGQVQGQEGGDNQMEEDLEMPAYPMTSSPKGVCVIINNRNFAVDTNDPQSKEMPERRGTDVDATNLRETFDKLDFVVKYHENLTDNGMMQLLVDMAHNIDHKNFDCFVCCILTHGVLSHLYGTNGKLVRIKDLTSVFQANRCPSLAGKPKLFFLQACQGRDKMGAQFVLDLVGNPKERFSCNTPQLFLAGEIEKDACPHGTDNFNGNVETDNDREMIPNESDFLVGYATVAGYVSFRSRDHGSWYIRKLCELIEKYSERHDLMSILIKVNEEVAQGNAHVDGGIFKQTPAPVVTLRKKLYFFPQNRRST